MLKISKSQRDKNRTIFTQKLFNFKKIKSNNSYAIGLKVFNAHITVYELLSLLLHPRMKVIILKRHNITNQMKSLQKAFLTGKWGFLTKGVTRKKFNYEKHKKVILDWYNCLDHIQTTFNTIKTRKVSFLNITNPDFKINSLKNFILKPDLLMISHHKTGTDFMKQLGDHFGQTLWTL